MILGFLFLTLEENDFWLGHVFGFDLLPAPSDFAASKLAEMGWDDHVDGDDLHSGSRTMMREWQIVWEAQKVEWGETLPSPPHLTTTSKQGKVAPSSSLFSIY